MVFSILKVMSLRLHLCHCTSVFADYWKVTKRKKIIIKEIIKIMKDSSASPNASLLLNLHLFQVVIE